MAPKICRQCRKPVPKNAPRCPHCGAVPKTKKKASYEALIGVGGCLVPLVLILMMFTLCAAP